MKLLFFAIFLLINQLQLTISLISDDGDALFLTPYIESKKLVEARSLSRVGPLPNVPNITSYSGFLTVNKKYNSNLFFWFFPAFKNPSTSPVLLWLQGGPGTSSNFGLFVLHGPYILDANLNVHIRNYSWAQEYSIIYIDQPVGTGFSFTEDERGYVTTGDDIAHDLYEALQQFFTIFHEYRKNDFYVTGESYGCKFSSAIAHKIHIEGSKANINLKGIAVGNGLCDPETMMYHGDVLYQFGLIDETQRDYFIEKESKAKTLITQEKYIEALVIVNSLLFIEHSTLANFTGMSFYYNILHSTEPDEYNYFVKFVTLPKIRKAIHVGNVTLNKQDSIRLRFYNDVMLSVKPLIATLLDNNYKVLIYNGQFDLLIAAPLSERFVRSIKWKHNNEFLNAHRVIWKVSHNDREVAGYVKRTNKFYHVIVRNGGHMVPYDQPRVAYDMIKRFINNDDFQK